MREDRIQISDEQEAVPLDRPLILAAALKALESEGSEKDLSLAYVGGEKIRELNRQYLGHDWETDVIAFPLEDGMDSLLGEVVVSTKAAVDEAGKRGIPPMTEVLLYTVHGILHLLGYDDDTPEAAAEMRKQESRIIRSL